MILKTFKLENCEIQSDTVSLKLNFFSNTSKTPDKGNLYEYSFREKQEKQTWQSKP